MDPLTFVLGVAGSILTDVVADLITGRAKAAQKAEIALQVESILVRRLQRESHELKLLVHEIMGEIEILSKRNPDLVVTQRRIRLKPPTQKVPFFSGKDGYSEEELHSKLMRLGKLIEQRREELALPLMPVEETGKQLAPAQQDNQPDAIDVDWEYVGPKKLSSQWARQLEDMDEKIRRRRAERT